MSKMFSAEGPAGELVFRGIRGFVRIVIFRWLRLEYRNAERLRVDGPLIIAPVHRSNLDGPLIGGLTNRRVQYLGKEELFPPGVGGWVMRAVGSFPVKRGSADLEAMRAAKGILDDGNAMLVFPEGSRQEGIGIGELQDGAAWLSSKTGTNVVPVGIVGTHRAMPPGVRIPRRENAVLLVGEPMEPPTAANGNRASRAELREWTEELGKRLSSLQAEAEAMLTGR